MKKIWVRLKDRRYPVLVGYRILDQALDGFHQEMQSRHAVLISDQRLKHGLKRLKTKLEKQGWRTTVLSLKVSEELKDFEKLYPLYGKLLEARADRNSVIFALGGGVIGDLAGFVAATYSRGI